MLGYGLKGPSPTYTRLNLHAAQLTCAKTACAKTACGSAVVGWVRAGAHSPTFLSVTQIVTGYFVYRWGAGNRASPLTA
jgi:hypothetical protein